MDDLRHHKYLWRTGLAAWAAILGVALYAAASTPSTFTRSAALAVVAGLAAFWSIGLIGFIFGLPPAEDDASNQSLSQVSDWLTKLIIGASLVQIRAIGSFIVDVGETLGAGSKLAAGTQLFTALIVATGVCGFIFFYFWAYMYWNRLREDAQVRQLSTLERLHTEGMIDTREFNARRNRLITSLVGPNMREPTKVAAARRKP